MNLYHFFALILLLFVTNQSVFGQRPAWLNSKQKYQKKTQGRDKRYISPGHGSRPDNVWGGNSGGADGQPGSSGQPGKCTALRISVLYYPNIFYININYVISYIILLIIKSFMKKGISRFFFWLTIHQYLWVCSVFCRRYPGSIGRELRRCFNSPSEWCELTS